MEYPCLTITFHLLFILEKNSRLSDEGLHFLLLLVDVQVLFDAALGLYDFDLVREIVFSGTFNILIAAKRSHFFALFSPPALFSF